MPVTIDKFEYATDAAAQAAWNLFVEAAPASATADSQSDASHAATKAIDSNLTTAWNSTNTAFPHWHRVDFGAGVAYPISKIVITKNNVSSNGSMIKDFIVEGSNDNSSWTLLYTGTATNGVNGSTEAFEFENSTAYRYYRITISSNYWSGVNHSGFLEIEFFYYAIISVTSESTIKEEGSYSMRVVAPQTTSLNKTITHTCSPTLNFTDQDEIKFKIRSSRTGTNLKIGFHDSGGTTTESNIAISSADTWEEKTIDISAVTNANKDAIDLITITITNADAENTIYLDELMAYVTGEGVTTGYDERYSSYNRNSLLPMRGRSRDLPTGLIIEKIG